jgi:hypothetical protein
MNNQYEKAASVFAEDQDGNLGTLELHYGMELPNLGISVNEATNRITFDRRIHKIEIFDGGNIRTVRRRIPLIGRPIEVGVPPPTPFPSVGIRISFDDIKGKHASIRGLQLLGGVTSPVLKT